MVASWAGTQGPSPQAKAVPWLHISTFLEALASGAVLGKRAIDDGSLGILGLEVIPCRELHNCWGGPTVVCGTTRDGAPTGMGSHNEAVFGASDVDPTMGA